MDIIIKKKYDAPIRHELPQIDRSIDNKIILKQIEGVNPNYASHMLARNDIVRDFAMSIFGGIDLLDQPMCTKCEAPATWHTGHTGYCTACGTTIQKPITLREYLLEQIDLPPEYIEHLQRALNAKKRIDRMKNIDLGGDTIVEAGIEKK